MTILEKSVIDLANALEGLEAQIESQQDDSAAKSDLIASARKQSRAAQGHATNAGRDLSGAIDELKALLSDQTPNSKG